MNDHIPDLTKMIGETPRTDAAWKPDGGDGYPTVDVDLARQLERELNAAHERIKRMEEALTWYESTVSDCNRHGPKGDVARDELAKDQGRKAKEAKP